MLSLTQYWDADWFDIRAALSSTYNSPIYPHTPLATIIVWPLVKTVNILVDYNIIPHLEQQPGLSPDVTTNPEALASLKAETATIILRCVSIVLAMTSFWLIYKVLLTMIGKYALFFALPIAGSTSLLSGAMFFYWDVFMAFFFVLTLYLMVCHPHSKWKYVTACCLVNTKMFLGIAFLFPLFVQEFVDDYKTGWKWPIPGWKMALPALSIIPFYIATIVVTHDPFYVIGHYTAQMPQHDFIYAITSLKDYVVMCWNLGMFWYVPMTIPILFYFKKYPALASFWLIVFVYGWATGMGMTHLSNLLYSGALVFPLVAYEFHLAR